MSLPSLLNNSHVNLTLLDQGIVSGVNFLTGIILARALGLDGFGQFSLVWVAVLFINSLQSALITSPMMSIGPKIAAEEMDGYYGGSLVQQFVFAAGTSLLLAWGAMASARLAAAWEVSGLAWPLAFACFSFQMQEFIRRYYFVRQQPKKATLNDAISYGGQIGLLAALLLAGVSMDTGITLWVIAATSFVAFLYGAADMKTFHFEKAAVQETMQRHWNFGSWLSISNTIHWSGTQGLLLLAGAMMGTAVVGGIRAVLNLTAPVNILMQGLLNIMPVRASHLLTTEGHAGMARYLWRTTLYVMLGLGVMCLVIVMLQDVLMALLYGTTYLPYTPLILWQCIYILVGGLLFPLSIYYRSMEKTKTYALCLSVAAPSAIMATWLTLEALQAKAVFLGLIINQVFALLSAAVVLWLSMAKKLPLYEEAKE